MAVLDDASRLFDQLKVSFFACSSFCIVQNYSRGYKMMHLGFELQVAVNKNDLQSASRLLSALKVRTC